MFLNRLSAEQKELFLDLCIHASKSNQNYSAEEKSKIMEYCEEMRTEIRFDEHSSLAEAAERLVAVSTPQELRMIVLETAALIISDNVYDDDEKKFFETLTAKLGLNKQETDGVFDMLNELTAVYQKIYDFIEQ